jgi:hypothetical protein
MGSLLCGAAWQVGRTGGGWVATTGASRDSSARDGARHVSPPRTAGGQADLVVRNGGTLTRTFELPGRFGMPVRSAFHCA